MQKSPKILIVDDSKSSRALLKTILNKTGYKNIFTADCAKDAFELLGMNNENPEPSVAELNNLSENKKHLDCC